MEEAHEMLIKEGCTKDLDWGEDVVNRPKHYNTGNIECIDAITGVHVQCCIQRLPQGQLHEVPVAL